MNICIITGSSGLIGSESVTFFAKKFDKIIGIDNNMRQVFFGAEASTEWNTKLLIDTIPNFEHYNSDIRNLSELENIFYKYGSDIKLVIHTAAQPSHDWATNNESVGSNQKKLSRCHIYFYIYQQSIWRYTKLFAIS